MKNRSRLDNGNSDPNMFLCHWLFMNDQTRERYYVLNDIGPSDVYDSITSDSKQQTSQRCYFEPYLKFLRNFEININYINSRGEHFQFDEWIKIVIEYVTAPPLDQKTYNSNEQCSCYK